MSDRAKKNRRAEYARHLFAGGPAPAPVKRYKMAKGTKPLPPRANPRPLLEAKRHTRRERLIREWKRAQDGLDARGRPL
jgi:hypothetical protein